LAGHIGVAAPKSLVSWLSASLVLKWSPYIVGFGDITIIIRYGWLSAADRLSATATY
jgi:hypothetical protein